MKYKYLSIDLSFSLGLGQCENIIKMLLQWHLSLARLEGILNLLLIIVGIAFELKADYIHMW